MKRNERNHDECYSACQCQAAPRSDSVAHQALTHRVLGVESAVTILDWCPSVVPCLLPTGVLVLLPPPPGRALEVETPVGQCVFEAVESASGRREKVDMSHATAREVDEVVEYLLDCGFLRKLPRTPEPMLRWDRQLRWFAQTGADAVRSQQRLQASSVLVIGLGGVGGSVVEALGRAGVGRLVGADFDTVDLENLPRQQLFVQTDVGAAKVAAARYRMAQILAGTSSTFTAEEFQVRSSADLQDIVSRWKPDVLVLAADSPALELARWANETAFEQKVPLVSAGQRMPLIHVGPFVIPGQTPCLECCLGEPLSGELAKLVDAWSRPLPGFGPGDSIGGNMVASEIVAFLTGIQRPGTYGARFELNLQTLSSSLITSNATCRLCDGRSAQEAA